MLNSKYCNKKAVSRSICLEPTKLYKQSENDLTLTLTHLKGPGGQMHFVCGYLFSK